jgi:hypothetical protein
MTKKYPRLTPKLLAQAQAENRFRDYCLSTSRGKVLHALELAERPLSPIELSQVTRWLASAPWPGWRGCPGRPKPPLAACRTEALRLNAESDFVVAGFRLALDRTLIPV